MESVPSTPSPSTARLDGTTAGPTGRAATITDVARIAGVGVGTVSRVINGSPRVSDATRARVRAVIEDLDYRPNSVAQRLSRGRTLTVGVVVYDLTNPSVVERLKGLVDGLGAAGMDMALFNVESAEQRDRLFDRLLRGGGVDGLIIVSLGVGDEDAARLVTSRLPVVLLDVAHARLPSIVVDDRAGGALAAHHLLDLGHRRVAFVGDDGAGPFGFTACRDRLEGFRTALAGEGVDLPDDLVILGRHDRVVAEDLSDRILSRDDPPSAVFAASDTQAIGVLTAAGGAGRRVPTDLSVIGYDDIDVASFVGLTTVRQPLRESGIQAAAMIRDALSGIVDRSLTRFLSLEVAVRSTTAAAGGEG